MEKAHIVTDHKKGDKQYLKIYRITFLLPIFSKILQDLIFNELVTFFADNKLFFSNQSGFTPGDSCVNQLLAITQEIYKSFDDELEVRGVFLDISKTFDKIRLEGLLLKISKWHLWKSFKTVRLFSMFLQATSSSKWTTVTLGEC